MLESQMVSITSNKITEVQKYLKDTFDLDFRLRSKLFLAGGAVLSMVRNEKPNDWDFYLDAKPEYVKGFLDKLVKALEDHENAHDILITPSAITLKKLKVQIVTRYYGKPEHIINLFDFAHTQMYITNEEVYISPLAWKSIAQNKLYYTGSQYPLSALFRMRKFMKRGFDIDVGQITKIAIEISQFDFFGEETVSDDLFAEDPTNNDIFVRETIDDQLGEEPYIDDELAQAYSDTDIPPTFLVNMFGIEALYDQLIGVDVTIFANVIEEMRDAGELTIENVFDIIDSFFA